MRSDVVALLRKDKFSIPAAPMNRDLRQATGYFDFLLQPIWAEARMLT